jgi:hypothetical protein
MSVLAQRISRLEAAEADYAGTPRFYISDRPHDDAEIEQRLAGWRGRERAIYDISDREMSIEEWINTYCAA